MELLETDVLHPDNLVIGADPLKSVYITLAAGAGDLARGTVLGMVAATEEYVLCDKALLDGGQTARAVLAEAATLGGAAVQALAYTEGVINEGVIALAAGTTADDVREDLRSFGIILKSSLDIQP